MRRIKSTPHAYCRTDQSWTGARRLDRSQAGGFRRSCPANDPSDGKCDWWTAENVIDQVKAYDTFSAPDRKVIFSTSINAPQLGGARPYADEADWRNVKAASYKLSKYVEDNRTSESDQSSPQNVQMQKALELLQSRQQDTGWAKQIADLFGGRGDIKDRIDLSPEAQKLVGDLSPKTTTSAPYVQGSIASKIA